MICSRCHQSLRSLMLFAILVDTRLATVSGNIVTCPDGEAHVFVEQQGGGR